MKRGQLQSALLVALLMFCSEIAPAIATNIAGKRCSSFGSQTVTDGLLFTCVTSQNGFNWDSGFKCKKLGQKIQVNRRAYVCRIVRNSLAWSVSSVGDNGKVIFDSQGLDSQCESGKSGVHTSIPISIRGLSTVSKRLHSGREIVELASGKYSIKLFPFVCHGTRYSPLQNSVTVNVQVGKTSAVVLQFGDTFDIEFKRITHLEADSWNEKHVSDPLTYKLGYVDLKQYARGALCSYIATGLDDFTLGSYISNEVSFDQDIQLALLSATRLGYGCRAA